MEGGGHQSSCAPLRPPLHPREPEPLFGAALALLRDSPSWPSPLTSTLVVGRVCASCAATRERHRARAGPRRASKLASVDWLARNSGRCAYLAGRGVVRDRLHDLDLLGTAVALLILRAHLPLGLGLLLATLGVGLLERVGQLPIVLHVRVRALAELHALAGPIRGHLHRRAARRRARADAHAHRLGARQERKHGQCGPHRAQAVQTQINKLAVGQES